jgi:hypothetical protein
LVLWYFWCCWEHHFWRSNKTVSFISLRRAIVSSSYSFVVYLHIYLAHRTCLQIEFFYFRIEYTIRSTYETKANPTLL